MKFRTIRFLSFLCFILVVPASYAQNKYLLLEYIRLKPGITDSSSIITNIGRRLQDQNAKDHSVIQSALWQNANTASKEYQYVVATLFKNFNDYMGEYKNNNNGLYYSISKGRIDTVHSRNTDTFDIVYTPIFEQLAETGGSNKQPQLMLCTNIKASPGKEIAFESLELKDWLPIHQDLIKQGYESGYSLNKIMYPNVTPYNYDKLLYFGNEAMFDKQNDIDYDPYMRSNQSAFINAGTLRSEVHSDLFVFVTAFDLGDKKK